MASGGSRQWTGRRVLVTGGDGFLGSHLIERLLVEQAVVAALVRPSSTTGTVGYALRNLGSVQHQLERVIATDVAGSEAVDTMVQWRPDVLFHLAADAYVERSFQFPEEVLRTNLGGTMNALAVARRLPSLQRVVVTSSSEVYGAAQRERIDESHPLEPTSPYAASKVAADRMALAFHVTYGVPVAVLRPFNTYGPRHVYDVIPKFIARALRGDPIAVYGTGEQSRDFTYVTDMVEAFVSVGLAPQAVGRAINFGRGIATPILELAGRVRALCGSASVIEHAPPRRAEVERLCCDASAAAALGWSARVDLEDGLRKTIAWARGEG